MDATRDCEMLPPTLPMPSAPPTPVGCLYSHVRQSGGGGVTPIVRFWTSDEDAARCQLCPRGRCSYDPEFRACLVSVPELVPEGELLTFSARGRAWVDGPD